MSEHLSSATASGTPTPQKCDHASQVDRVREGLREHEAEYGVDPDALAALDSLAAHIEKLELLVVDERDRWHAAEVHIEQIERERDEWAREFKRVQDIGFANSDETAALINAELTEQAEAALQRVEALEAALREIAEEQHIWGQNCRAIARRALNEEKA